MILLKYLTELKVILFSDIRTFFTEQTCAKKICVPLLYKSTKFVIFVKKLKLQDIVIHIYKISS